MVDAIPVTGTPIFTTLDSEKVCNKPAVVTAWICDVPEVSSPTESVKDIPVTDTSAFAVTVSYPIDVDKAWPVKFINGCNCPQAFSPQESPPHPISMTPSAVTAPIDVVNCPADEIPTKSP